jgi:hypothetical protein
MEHKPSSKHIDDIVNSAWQRAARTNPMLLAMLLPDKGFGRLRELALRELAKGYSASEVSDRIVHHLFATETNEAMRDVASAKIVHEVFAAHSDGNSPDPDQPGSR